MVKKELLDILCCPDCKGDVEEKEGKVVCADCGRRYPIKDDIPIMLVEESELPIDKKE
jgi:uncharacterized protein